MPRLGWMPTEQPPPIPFDFPLRENCHPTNPWQAFMWMFVALPGVEGAQLLMNMAHLTHWSKRVWDCGGRPVEPPIIKWRKPRSAQAFLLGNPGDWVPIDAPDDEDPRTPARRNVDQMASIQKAEHFREIAKDMTPHERFIALKKAQAEMGDSDDAT